jgi:hypothetical protein
MTSNVKVVLRDPTNFKNTIDYTINVLDNPMGRDWINALEKLLVSGKMLEKNFCFMGFPQTARDLPYLCDQLNQSITQINKFQTTGTWDEEGLEPYIIEDFFVPETVRFHDGYPIADFGSDPKKLGMNLKHGVMNRLHNHFERLQGTVWDLSPYYKSADYSTKYAIRQLNNLCHEIESLVLSQRKMVASPKWVRPSQITTWLTADRYDITEEHRQLFAINGYDRVMGGVYMHWTQIGKTLFEVFRDEGAPDLIIGKDPTDIRVGSGTTCEAITALKYYSGEFDIEWGNDVVYGKQPWHTEEQDNFREWLGSHDLDYQDPRLSLGYLPIGQVDMMESFGTVEAPEVWAALGKHLDIHSVEVGNTKQVYDYCWSDEDYKQTQIDMLKPGYDYQMRNKT